ncbi:MAG: flagellar hook-associated protein 3 [Armatimonadetes bacterium]|nr:flagellar hook-associated protein 3 [Armatimonadota bacterium]NIM24355.1 flagellar hook-associated protein 3 [Armatimonadota bacterium]NIM68224.1 flagellar hook-associated protein 3 [Armatimonadota bacterium]NIM75125.1 flagellar hook-associated protein 3 [Armatimonadota bacterium]NIN06429.1 flagellar hook-associated protein 3 [Armatimonadota bacterium]
MRITDSMMNHNLIARMGRTVENLYRLQEQMASGLRINRPSDEPVGAVRAAALRSALAEVAQYKKNAEEADALLTMTESSLGEVVNLLRVARQYALAGATGTVDTTTREALAQQVEQVLQAVVGTANSERAGRFLFAGHKINDAPFSLDLAADPPVTYSGDGGVAVFEVGRTSTVAVNLPGDQVFNMNGQADPALPDLFATLDLLKDALLAEDLTQIQTSLTQIDEHLSRILVLRGEVGARQQGIELALNRLSDSQLSLTESLSNTEDADFARVMLELQTQENVYQATAAVAAMLSGNGLTEFLR